MTNYSRKWTKFKPIVGQLKDNSWSIVGLLLVNC